MGEGMPCAALLPFLRGVFISSKGHRVSLRARMCRTRRLEWVTSTAHEMRNLYGGFSTGVLLHFGGARWGVLFWRCTCRRRQLPSPRRGVGGDLGGTCSPPPLRFRPRIPRATWLTRQQPSLQQSCSSAAQGRVWWGIARPRKSTLGSPSPVLPKHSITRFLDVPTRRAVYQAHSTSRLPLLPTSFPPTLLSTLCWPR